MGKLADKHKDQGKGVVMQKMTPQTADLEQLGNGWFSEKNNGSRVKGDPGLNSSLFKKKPGFKGPQGKDGGMQDGFDNLNNEEADDMFKSRFNKGNKNSSMGTFLENNNTKMQADLPPLKNARTKTKKNQETFLENFEEGAINKNKVDEVKNNGQGPKFKNLDVSLDKNTEEDNFALNKIQKKISSGRIISTSKEGNIPSNKTQHDSELRLNNDKGDADNIEAGQLEDKYEMDPL